MTMQWLDRSLMISPVSFGLCLNEDDFKAELKRLGVTEETPFLGTTHSSATAHYFEAVDRNPPSCCCIVTLGSTKGRTTEQVYALLTHEAVHIWQRCKQLLGEERPGREQEAYAIQNIAQELMQSYRQQTSKKK